MNQFSGSSLLLASKRLLIPIKKRYILGSSHDGAGGSSHCSNNSSGSSGSSSGVKFQNTGTQEYKIHKVLSECDDLGMKEIQA